MLRFRVTKYDPAHRRHNGAYRRNEWTSVDDVGRRFPDGVLTVGDYLRTERLYVEAVGEALRLVDPTDLRIDGLESHGYHEGILCNELDDESRALYSKFHAYKGALSPQLACEFTVAVLRSLLWGRIVGAGGFYVHFGSDYYMCMGDEGGRLACLRVPGLFVEDFPSPYG